MTMTTKQINCADSEDANPSQSSRNGIPYFDFLYPATPSFPGRGWLSQRRAVHQKSKPLLPRISCQTPSQRSPAHTLTATCLDWAASVALEQSARSCSTKRSGLSPRSTKLRPMQAIQRTAKTNKKQNKGDLFFFKRTAWFLGPFVGIAPYRGGKKSFSPNFYQF
jgi:hypothetical protein